MLYIILLVVIEIALFALNYIPGTYLIGWDNIMPEFNLGLNLNRAISSIWQEYRGLGLLDGMAHSANLFHTIYIFILSLFMPESAVRYVFIYLTHLIGGISFFYLLKYLTQNKKASFLGALFYMFNLGIIQVYFAPLEVFTINFAMLPLLTLFIIKALKNTNRKSLLLLFFVSLASTPQAFVPTVFLISLILFLFLIISHILFTKKWKNALLVFAVFLIANIFWLMPYVYNSFQNASVIQNTRINQFSSEEIFYRNKAHGDILSVLTLKGFMLNSVEYDALNNRHINFMGIWKNHYSTILYKVVFFFFLGISAIGITTSIRSRKKIYLPFVASFAISFIFLANNTFILEQLNNFIRYYFPLVGEVLRFPFTKFINLFVFCFSVFFTIGLISIGNRLKKQERIFIPIIFLLIAYLAYPAFLGNFNSSLLKLKIPKEYFQTINYFNSQDQTQRVALLPANSFWNWQYRSWGHVGSGFLWYGIKQPILERAFDPWSIYNEQFYNEISYAINIKDENLFEKVLKKYDVKYILFDQSIRNASTQQAIEYDRIKDFLSENSYVKKDKEFDNIVIYKTSLNHSWVYQLESSTLKIFPNYIYEKKDNLVSDERNYVVYAKNPDIVPLFPSLFTEKLQENVEFQAKNLNDALLFSPKKDFPYIKDYNLEVPSLFKSEFFIPVQFEIREQALYLTPIYPKIFINKTEIAIPIMEEQIYVPLAKVQNPTSIKFMDIKHEFKQTLLGNSYLLNKYPNVIKVKDDNGNEDLILIDTRNIEEKSYLIVNSNNEPLESIKVEIAKFISPLASNDLIKTDKYEIQKTGDKINSENLNQVKDKEILLEASSKSAELAFYKDDLYHQASYILFIKSAYQLGLPVNMYVDNSFEGRAELETKLSKNDLENVVVIPKTQDYFQGYGLHFGVRSIGQEKAKSSIQEVGLYPFPFAMLKEMKLVNPNFKETKSVEASSISFQKTGTFLYSANIPFDKNYVVLSQAFDPGWKAYKINSQLSILNFQLTEAFPFLFGKEIKEHILVNNWANGWVINNSQLSTLNSQIVIIFWPQYLQYLGFFAYILLPIIFYIIFRKKKKSTN